MYQLKIILITFLSFSAYTRKPLLIQDSIKLCHSSAVPSSMSSVGAPVKSVSAF